MRPFKVPFLLLFLLAGSIADLCDAQSQIAPKLEDSEKWKSAQLAELDQKLASESISATSRDELAAQKAWLKNWSPESMSAKPSGSSQLPAAQEEFTLNSPESDPLRDRIAAFNDQPTDAVNRSVQEKALQKSLEDAIALRPYELAERQILLQWLDEPSRRKSFLNEIDEAARQLIHSLKSIEIDDAALQQQVKLATEFAMYRRARALAYRELPDVVEKSPIKDPQQLDKQIQLAYQELIESAGKGRPEFILLEIRMLRRDQQYGSALGLLEKYGSSIQIKWFLKKRRDLLKELGWDIPYAQAAKIYAEAFPAEVAKEQKRKELQASKKTSADNRLAELQAKLDAAIKQLHADSKFPGCTFSIVLPYGDVLTSTAGFSDKEKEIAMKPTDRMMSASIGKTYFAAIALKLIHDKSLSLDDKISKHLGDQDWFLRIPNAEDITVAHIMRHQSGLPRYILNRQVWNDLMSDSDMVWKPGDQLKYVYDAEPLFAAGKDWAYSDTNYILLGLIIEKLNGESVYKAVNELLLQPNHLDDTVPNDRRELPGLTQGYSTTFGVFGVPPKVIGADNKFVFNPQMEWCGGGFLCTSSDLARWGHIYFSGKVYQESYIETLTNNSADCKGGPGEGSRYGLGVFLRPTNLGESLGHDGGFPGYTSTMAYFPKHKVSAALMFNTDSSTAISKSALDTMVEIVHEVLK